MCVMLCDKGTQGVCIWHGVTAEPARELQLTEIYLLDNPEEQES